MEGLDRADYQKNPVKMNANTDRYKKLWIPGSLHLAMKSIVLESLLYYCETKMCSCDLKNLLKGNDDSVFQDDSSRREDVVTGYSVDTFFKNCSGFCHLSRTLVF